jgi:hypothetical protein
VFAGLNGRELNRTTRAFAHVIAIVQAVIGEIRHLPARLRRGEPGVWTQGTGFFLFLMVAFGALLVWLALTKQVVFRVFAACLAFLPAMVFGIAVVNKFYDYYQTWGGMINDLTGQSTSSIPRYAAGPGSNKQFDKNIGRVTSTAEDAEVGYLFRPP